MGHVLRLEAGALTATAMRGGRPEYAQFLRERKPGGRRLIALRPRQWNRRCLCRLPI